MSKINYDLKLIRGIALDVDGVLSPGTVPMGNDGVPMRMANMKDGYAMKVGAARGLKFAIITGADTEAVRLRFAPIGITDVYLKTGQKLPLLIDWMNRNSLSPEQVAFVGDDIPDIAAMRHVGLAVAPRDASVDAKAVANYISPVDGGYGVVRDLVEEVMRAQGIWPTEGPAFG